MQIVPSSLLTYWTNIYGGSDTQADKKFSYFQYYYDNPLIPDGAPNECACCVERKREEREKRERARQGASTDTQHGQTAKDKYKPTLAQRRMARGRE